MDRPPILSRPATRRSIAALCIAAAVAVALFYPAGPAAPPRSGATLGALEAHRQATAGGLVLVDIRTPGEWRATGIPEGAHPLDMRREDFVAALRALAGPAPDAAIALICARGVRSAALADTLAAAGFRGVLDVAEGVWGSPAGPGWLARGLPLHPPPANPG